LVGECNFVMYNYTKYYEMALYAMRFIINIVIIVVSETLITLSMPVFYNHTFIGVAAVDITVAELSSAVPDRYVHH